MLSGSFSTYDILQYLVRLGIIFLILPLHEYAHAWTAYKLGDDTASCQGRLTLNPLAHVDPIGAICLLLTGFGWAKPVPIDPTRFTRKHSMRFGVAITALAGPLSNLIAGFVGMLVLRFYEISDMYTQYTMTYDAYDTSYNTPMIVYYIIYYFVSINIGLAVFNLVPIPPLDGSKILSYFTSGKFDRWYYQNQTLVRFIFLAIVVTGVLSVPLGILDTAVYALFRLLTNWIPSLFG